MPNDFNWDQYGTENSFNWEDFKAEQASNADASPAPYKPTVTPAGIKGGIMDVTPSRAASAAAGVDTITSPPSGSREGMEVFSNSESSFGDYLASNLKKIRGKDTPVRKGPTSGEWEWYNDSTNRWTTFNSGAGQVALKMSKPFAEGAAGLAASSLTGGAGALVQGTAGSALAGGGAGLVDYAFRKAGDVMGVNEGDESSRLAPAAKNAAIGTGIGVGLSGLVGAGKYVRDAVRGASVFSSSEAQSILNDMGKYDDITNALGLNVPLHRTLPVGHPMAAEAEQAWQLAQQGAGVGLRQKFNQMNADTYSALRSYFGNASTEAGATTAFPQGAAGRRIAGQGVQDAAQAQIQQATQGTQQNLNNAVQASQQAVQNVRGQGVPLNAQQAGQSVRNVMDSQMQASAANVDGWYSKYHANIGYDPAARTSTVRVPVSRSDKEMIGWLEDMGVDSTNGARIGFKPSADKDNVYYDLATIEKARTNINAGYGGKTKGGTNITATSVDTARQRAKVSELVDNYLAEASSNGTLPPDTYQNWLSAKQAAAQDKRTFGAGIRATFLKQDPVSGEYVINDQPQILRLLASKDVDAINELKDIIKDDPTAMSNMKQLLGNMAAKASNVDGRISAKAFRRFMSDDNYGPIMKAFWGDTPQALGNFEQLANDIVATTKADRMLRSQLRQQLRGVDRWQPEEIVSKLFTGSMKNDQASIVRDLATRTPGGIQDLRNGVVNELRAKYFDVNGKLDTQGLANFMNTNGQKLRIIMGDGYYGAMDLLAKSSPVVMREASNSRQIPSASIVQKLIRRVFPQFGTEGRMLQAGVDIRSAQYSQNVYNALTDLQELRRLANRSNIIRSQVDLTSRAGVPMEAYKDAND